MTQRLSNAKEVASKPAALQSHEDLAKKLQVNPTFAILAFGVMCLFFFLMVLKIVLINSDDITFSLLCLYCGDENGFVSLYINMNFQN